MKVFICKQQNGTGISYMYSFAFTSIMSQKHGLMINQVLMVYLCEQVDIVHTVVSEPKE